MKNKRLTKLNKEMIPAYQHYAVERRYEGDSYQKIADSIKEIYGKEVSNVAVFYWFTAGQPLRDYFDQYAAQKIEEQLSLVQTLFASKAKDAAAVLYAIMKGTPVDGKRLGMTQYMAAKEWLDRAIGKTPDKLQSQNLNLNVNTTLTDLMQMAEYELKQNDQPDDTQRGSDPGASTENPN